MQFCPTTPAARSAYQIVARLQQAGYRAFWVGGCVRDALLGLPPKDYDVATDAPPDRIQALFPRHVAVGAAFGVVCVLDRGTRTEVATFRSDGDYPDGRRPASVTFGSPEEDAARRDFTINALFYDPVGGHLVDFAGGQSDLEGRVLRAIGDPAARFREDGLRLLRAVRFAARFDLRIDPGTWEALRGLAPGGLRGVSAERIRDELLGAFTGPRPGGALRLLEAGGLLAVVLPEVAALRGVAQPPQFHPEGDVFEHTVLALEALPPQPGPVLAAATLLHDIGKPPTFAESDRIRFNLHHQVGADLADAVCRRLRFSNADRLRITDLIRGHMAFMNVREMRPARLRRFLGRADFEDHLALHRADCLASHGHLDNYDFCRRAIEEFARSASEPILPPPLVRGDDLLAAGYRPGPRLGAALRAVRDAQLDGEVHTPEDALRWVRARFPAEDR